MAPFGNYNRVVRELEQGDPRAVVGGRACDDCLTALFTSKRLQRAVFDSAVTASRRVDEPDLLRCVRTGLCRVGDSI